MKKGIKSILGLLVVVIFATYFFGGGLENQVESEIQKIENQVAEDAAKQYQIAKRNGSSMDAYIQAGLTAAAYLQANDEENYKKWKAIENKEASNAGVSQ